jgi:hypothetical protein
MPSARRLNHPQLETLALSNTAMGVGNCWSAVVGGAVSELVVPSNRFVGVDRRLGLRLAPFLVPVSISRSRSGTLPRYSQPLARSYSEELLKFSANSFSGNRGCFYVYHTLNG